MSDYNSSLPIRSEADGSDQRLHIKIVDGTNPAVNQATVDSDKNLKVAVYGDKPDGADQSLRVSELGHAAVDGVYDASNNTDPSQMGLIAHERNASPGDSHQNMRLTAISNGTKRLLDTAIHDESGAAYSYSNPLPVSIEENIPGEQLHDFDNSTAISAGSSDSHAYTVPGSKVLKLYQVLASASGKMKMELTIDADGVGAGVAVTKTVQFNSTAQANCDITFAKPMILAAGTIVAVVRTNRDHTSQDVYSTLVGVLYDV